MVKTDDTLCRHLEQSYKDLGYMDAIANVIEDNFETLIFVGPPPPSYEDFGEHSIERTRLYEDLHDRFENFQEHAEIVDYNLEKIRTADDTDLNELATYPEGSLEGVWDHEQGSFHFRNLSSEEFADAYLWTKNQYGSCVDRLHEASSELEDEWSVQLHYIHGIPDISSVDENLTELPD